MEKTKKPLFIVILTATFFWMAYTFIIFIEQTFLWGDLEITAKEYYNQIVWLLIKNVPTLIVLMIVKHHWD